MCFNALESHFTRPFTDMHSVGGADMVGITFEMMKDVYNLRNDEYEVSELQYFIHRGDDFDIAFRGLV
jgi:hypothetical protein